MTLMLVQRPGMFTTVQDEGRYGSQRYGVPVNGAMDQHASRLANALVGNDASCAVLECTLGGPQLQFSDNVVIALCGGEYAARADGRNVPMNRAVVLRAGVTLDLQERRTGARLYVAVRGGIDVPSVLGSRSTYVRAGYGGVQGRALRRGDRVRIARHPAGMTRLERVMIQSGLPFAEAAAVAINGAPSGAAAATVRVIRGPQWRAFDAPSRQTFWRHTFTVSNQSDRMGYRLSGAAMRLTAPLEMISEPLNAGTIQVPPNGHPIILMADRQTAGGYPKAGYVATVDLPVLAQLAPGDDLCFEPISHRQAERAYLDHEQRMIALGDAARAAL